MESQELVAQLLPWLRPVMVAIVGYIAYRVLAMSLERRVRLRPELRMRVQLLLFAFAALLFLAIVVSMPLDGSTRGQVLQFIGLLLSAAIALSSTTFLGNLMAGMMLRSLNNFRIGDFLSVSGHFGRVSERGFFHTEIQTEDRDLTTLPNLFLVTNPVKVVNGDGTILSATVSLGYDAPRTEVERILLEAASDCLLDDAFVSVTELGDYSISYRLAGLMRDTKELVSRRSTLRKKMLDALHASGIEIVSPMFANHRAIGSRPVMYTPETSVVEDVADTAPEAIMFEKAEQAASLQMMRDLVTAIEHELDSLKKRLAEVQEPEERERLETRLVNLESYRDSLLETVGEEEA